MAIGHYFGLRVIPRVGDSPRGLNRFSYIDVTVHHVVRDGMAVYRHITARKL
jgi:hypothetical protein